MSFTTIVKLATFCLLLLIGMFWVLDKHYDAEDKFHQSLLAEFEFGMPHQEVMANLNAFDFQVIRLFGSESYQNSDNLTLEADNTDFYQKYGQVFHSLPKGSNTKDNHLAHFVYSMNTTSECVLLLGFSKANVIEHSQNVPKLLQLADVRCR